MSEPTVDPSWCLAHGSGAKVQRVTAANGASAISWWECPKCAAIVHRSPVTTPTSWPDLRALANAPYDGDGLHYFTKAHAAQLRALLAHIDGGLDA